MIDKAVQQRPNDGAIVDSLGWVLLREGDTKDAVKTLERAVELEPQDATINGHLGDAYWAAGRKLEATYPVAPCADLESRTRGQGEAGGAADHRPSAGGGRTSVAPRVR